MVRRKEPEESKPVPPARNIKVNKSTEARVKTGKPVPVAREDRASEPSSKPLRSPRRRGNIARILGASVLVVALLALGWFGARLVINAMNNDGGFAGLFNFGGSKLIGEENNRVNILLFGNAGSSTHEGPNLTDTIMVASYNPEEKFLHLFSVPRDLWVEIPSYGGTRINTVYQIGGVDDGQGSELLRNTVGDLLGLDIPYFLRIDFQGFEQIVDELGGIQVEVKKDLYDPLYPTENRGYQTLDVKAGTYTMGGDMALKYARSRETTSDFDRARRQQDIILALRQKAMDLDLLTSPSKMFAITDILSDHLSTNLTKEEMTRLLKLLADMDPTNVANKVFDDSASGLLYGTRVGEASVLKPVNDDYDKLAEFVATALNQKTPTSDEPVVEEKVEPLNIEVLNGTNVTGLAGKMATKLKEAGHNIVRVGNNPTKGVTQSLIYDNSGGKKAAAIRKLIEATGAKLSPDSLTLPTSIDVRLVVGSDAEAKLQ